MGNSSIVLCSIGTAHSHRNKEGGDTTTTAEGHGPMRDAGAQPLIHTKKRKKRKKKGEGRKGETREGGGNGGVSIICAQQPKDVVEHLPGGAP